MICNMCLHKTLFVDHVCVEDTANRGCPGCSKPIHNSTEKLNVLPCGHMLHQSCLRTLYDDNIIDCLLCYKPMIGININAYDSLIRESADLEDDPSDLDRANCILRVILSADAAKLPLAARLMVIIPDVLSPCSREEKEDFMSALLIPIARTKSCFPMSGASSPRETVPYVLYHLLHDESKNCVKLREELSEGCLVAVQQAAEDALKGNALGEAILGFIPMLHTQISQPRDPRNQADEVYSNRLVCLGQTALCKALGELSISELPDDMQDKAWVSEVCSRAAESLTRCAELPAQCAQSCAQLANNMAYFVAFW